VQALLEDEGFDVQRQRWRPGAGRQPRSPADLVISDVMSPRPASYEAILRRLAPPNARLGGTPVIFFSPPRRMTGRFERVRELAQARRRPINIPQSLLIPDVLVAAGSAELVRAPGAFPLGRRPPVTADVTDIGQSSPSPPEIRSLFSARVAKKAADSGVRHEVTST